MMIPPYQPNVSSSLGRIVSEYQVYMSNAYCISCCVYNNAFKKKLCSQPLALCRGHKQILHAMVLSHKSFALKNATIVIFLQTI